MTATAAPARFPYLEHRTCAEIMEVSERVDRMFATARMLSGIDGAKHLTIARVDNSTCPRCGARNSPAVVS